MEDQAPVYIIGAGISGLIAAIELEKEGLKPIILEKSNSVGGRVKTINEKGFALDLGFQVLLDAYPLAQHYLDMEDLVLQKLASGALIYSERQSYQIGDPSRDFKMLLPTLFAQVGSIRDKLKILKLNKQLKKKSLEEIFARPETSTLDYLQSFDFSAKIIDRFFRPFFAGIFLEPDLRTSSRMFEFVYKMFGEGYATIPKNGIGAISEQLKGQLNHTEFRFNTGVESVSNEEIVLNSGEKIEHQDVIITCNASALISNLNDQAVQWKSCMCLYFEVDQTNIPDHTIALVADQGKLSNNLYVYKDEATGTHILSVTSLQYQGKTDQEMIDTITEEVKAYTGASQVDPIHHYRIDQALPDLAHLRMTAQPSQSKVLDRVFLAGDYLFNASLNAAMESGRLAAEGLKEKRKGIFV